MQVRLKILAAALSAAVLLTTSASAQKLVDPATVAPEHRAAAEKRRAEQIKQLECAKKADTEKVLPRERTGFMIHCLEADHRKE